MEISTRPVLSSALALSRTLPACSKYNDYMSYSVSSTHHPSLDVSSPRPTSYTMSQSNVPRSSPCASENNFVLSNSRPETFNPDHDLCDGSPPSYAFISSNHDFPSKKSPNSNRFVAPTTSFTIPTGTLLGMCQYKRGRCRNRRTVKKNGNPHSLCEYHKQKQIQYQRIFDRKARENRITTLKHPKRKSGELSSSSSVTTADQLIRQTPVEQASPRPIYRAWMGGENMRVEGNQFAPVIIMQYHTLAPPPLHRDHHGGWLFSSGVSPDATGDISSMAHSQSAAGGYSAHSSAGGFVTTRTLPLPYANPLTLVHPSDWNRV